MNTSGKKKPINFELWIRIECPDKDCGNWTFIPHRGIPSCVVCVVCRNRISTKGLEMKEVKRR